MSGLDFPVRGISLRRSGHDAGFVCEHNPLLLWHRMWTLFLSGCVSGMVHSLAVISGEAHWDLVPSTLERLESLTQIGLPRRTLVFKVGFSYVQGRFLLTDFLSLGIDWHESRCVCCYWGRYAAAGFGQRRVCLVAGK